MGVLLVWGYSRELCLIIHTHTHTHTHTHLSCYSLVVIVNILRLLGTIYGGLPREISPGSIPPHFSWYGGGNKNGLSIASL